MLLFKRKKNTLFPITQTEDVGRVSSDTDLQYFEETFADHRNASEEQNRRFIKSVIPKSRFRFIGGVLGVSFLLFIGTCLYLQVISGSQFRALAEDNRFREYTIPANRGIIYDRRGVVLARNDPTFQIVSSKEMLPDNNDLIEAVFTQISSSTGQSTGEMWQEYDDALYYKDEILLMQDIDYDTAMLIMAGGEEFDYVRVEIAPQRSYITDVIPSLSHVLGYVGGLNEQEYEEMKDLGYRSFDVVGKQGLEDFYETELRGRFGYEIVEVDARGHVERAVAQVDAVNGSDLHLTIDSKLQKLVEDSLIAHLAESEASRASVIVLDANNGEVLTLVSWPAYDSNDFTSGIDQETYSTLVNDEDLPLFPRAVAGEFPSGSTIKPVYAAAALIEGVVTPQTSFLSTGGLWVSNLWFFPDWRAGGHGITNIYHAIADSVNTYFYFIGGGFEDFDGLGIEKLMDWAGRFGFGQESGIDLFGEATGFLPSPEWKWEAKGEIWYIGDTYHVAIGQGDFLATPLQIARSTAVFANGGSLVTPHLNSEMHTTATQVIDSETAQIIETAMRRTVTQGSATSLQAASIEIAGKTGTAQWSTQEANHSWFTGFAPYDDPQVVVTVLIEEGADDSLAVPIARDVFNYWAGLGY